MANKHLSSAAIGLIAGLGLAALILFAIEWVSFTMAPPPTGIDLNDSEALGAHVAAMGLSPKLMLAFGWALASLAGTALAFRFSQGTDWISWAVALGIIVMIMPPMIAYAHPDWMFAAGVLVPLTAAFLVTRTWRKRLLKPKG